MLVEMSEATHLQAYQVVDKNSQNLLITLESPSEGQSEQLHVLPIQTPSKKIRGKGQIWSIVHTAKSVEGFNDWLSSDETSTGVKWSKRRRSSTWQGVKQYYMCNAPGCAAELEALFDSASDKVIVSSNGQLHMHAKPVTPARGLSESVKKAVRELMAAGLTHVPHIDLELQRQGFPLSPRTQLRSFVAREKARAADQRQQEDEEGGDGDWDDCSGSGWGDEQQEYSPEPEGTPQYQVVKRPASPTPTRKRAKLMDDAAIAELVTQSLEARRQSYSPYSRFAVGAALLCADGSVVTGANVENASYGLTNCAERTAVFRAVAEGKRQFTAIAIAADMGDKFVGPCGACRQVLAEFNARMPVFLAKTTGEVRTTSMAALLPMAFLPKDVPFINEEE